MWKDDHKLRITKIINQRNCSIYNKNRPKCSKINRINKQMFKD